MASNQQTLADAVGAKLREELGKPRTSHGEILADATAYNMAVAANDETTIGHLAEKYDVTGPKPAKIKEGSDPAPKPVNADDIATKVLAGLTPLLATDADGKPTKAASQTDLVALTERVNGIDSHLGRQDGPNGPTYRPIGTSSSTDIGVPMWGWIVALIVGLWVFLSSDWTNQVWFSLLYAITWAVVTLAITWGINRLFAHFDNRS